MALRVYSPELLADIAKRIVRLIPAATGRLPLDLASTSGKKVLAAFTVGFPLFSEAVLRQALIFGHDQKMFVWTESAVLTTTLAAKLTAELKAKSADAKLAREADRSKTAFVRSVMAYRDEKADENTAALLAREMAPDVSTAIQPTV